MSFAALNLNSFCCGGYYEFRKCDRISLAIDIALLATAAIIGGLILGGIIHISLPVGAGGFGHYFPWMLIGTCVVIGILDGVVSILKLNMNSSPLHRAVESRNRATWQTLLADTEAVCDRKDSKGRTPLHLAAQIGDVHAISDLLTAGADIDAKDQYDMTPLILALSYTHKQEQAALKLLETNAAVNVVSQGDEEHVKRGHDENHPGSTPLHLAAALGFESVVKQLLLRNANYDACDEDNVTPLYKAVLMGKAKVVQQLLDAGADVNIASKYGLSPLHLAVMEGNEAITNLLLQHPNIRSTKNKNGQTPLDIAQERNKSRVEQILLRKFPTN